MSQELEITPGAYAKIERGFADPSITRLIAIAHILEVDVLQWLQDGEAAGVISTGPVHPARKK